MRLFHFSENADIDRFVPRPVRTPAQRPTGMAWLNGPLVWAIAQAHQRLYLFPRECPRIVMWATGETADADRKAWLGDMAPGMEAVACVEQSWAERLGHAALARYELPAESFVDIHDVGMWVSPETVVPDAVARITDLPGALSACRTELRFVESLLPFKPVWNSTVHASGIRLRNAAGWH